MEVHSETEVHNLFDICIKQFPWTNKEIIHRLVKISNTREILVRRNLEEVVSMKLPEARSVLQNCHLSQDKENLVSTESKERMLPFVNPDVFLFSLICLYNSILWLL